MGIVQMHRKATVQPARQGSAAACHQIAKSCGDDSYLGFALSLGQRGHAVGLLRSPTWYMGWCTHNWWAVSPDIPHVGHSYSCDLSSLIIKHNHHRHRKDPLRNAQGGTAYAARVPCLAMAART